MDSQPFEWGHTKEAVEELENVLSCGKCGHMVDNPCTLGGCEHFFCQPCGSDLLGESCPVCGVPSHVKDAQPDRQLLNAVALCQKLSRMLNSEPGQSQSSGSQTSSPFRRKSRGTIEAPSCDDGFNMFVIPPEKTSSPSARRSTRTTKTAVGGSSAVKSGNASSRVTVPTKSKTTGAKSVPKRNVRQAKPRVPLSPEETSSSEDENQENEDQMNVKNERQSRPKRTSKKAQNSSHLSDESGSCLTNDRTESGSDKASDTTSRVRKTRKVRRQSFEISSKETNARTVNISTSSVNEAETSRLDRNGASSEQDGKINSSITSPATTRPNTSSRGRGRKANARDGRTGSALAEKTRMNSSLSHSDQSESTSCSTPRRRGKLNSSVTGTPTNNCNKRNAKGETLLHVATIKGEIEVVKSLLERGAKVNVKDNAGWTPLHEACNHGFLDIAELLLDYGAFISVPGMDNDTPLHDAVQNFQLDCVKLLVQRGASLTARNIHGYTPLDLVKTDEIRAALSLPVLQKAGTNTAKSLNAQFANDKVVILPTGLNREQKSKLHKCADLLNGEMASELTNKVTHVVVDVNSDGLCMRTIKYLQAVLMGTWIISYNWAEYCLENKERASEEAFEAAGATTSPDSRGPSKGRQNAQLQLPRLFSGCHFFFQGEFTYPTPDKDQLIHLVKIGGGEVLSREPRTETIGEFPATVPYHVSENADLVNCSYYIIHDRRDDPAHLVGHRICKASAQWLLDCIAYFQLDLNSPS